MNHTDAHAIRIVDALLCVKFAGPDIVTYIAQLIEKSLGISGLLGGALRVQRVIVHPRVEIAPAVTRTKPVLETVLHLIFAAHHAVAFDAPLIVVFGTPNCSDSITDAVTFDGVIDAVKQASAHENGGTLDVIN